MNALLILLTLVALGGALAAFWPHRSLACFSSYERLIGVFVLFVVGWPQFLTFFLAPLVWPGGSSGGFGPLLIWFLPGMLLSLALFANNLSRPRPQVDLAAVLQLSVLLVAMVFVAYGGFAITEIGKVAIPGLIALVTVLKPSPVRIDVVIWGARASFVLITASVLLAVVVNSGVVVEACRADKCGLAGQVLYSPFAGNGNVLGLAVALLLPFAAVRLDAVRAAAAIAGAVALAEVAGSRTAEIGIAATAILVAALLLAPRRRAVLWAGLVAAAMLSLVPALIPFQSDNFTFRGYLWIRARQLIAENPLFGHGPTAWSIDGESSIYTLNYSPHNGWLDLAAAVGLTGVAILIAAAALKLWSSDHEARSVLLVYFAALLATSTLESLYVPFTIGIVPFAAILPFLAGPGRMVTTRDDARAQSAHQPVPEADAITKEKA